MILKEVGSLPCGTAVLDSSGRVWTKGSHDGSGVNFTSGNARDVVRFYQKARMIEGKWQFTNDAGEVIKKHAS